MPIDLSITIYISLIVSSPDISFGRSVSRIFSNLIIPNRLSIIIYPAVQLDFGVERGKNGGYGFLSINLRIVN